MNRWILRAAALVPVIAVAPTVHAQVMSPEQIVVTATRKGEALENIPGSVMVIAGERMEAVNAFNSAEEIVQLVPGLQAAVANGTQIAFQIRGVGAVDHQALTPTATAVYSDGVYLATNVQTGLMLYDLDRVEVLKGPQGALYGRNASGGAINFLSNRPGAEQGSYLGVSYGSFDRVDVNGAVGASTSDRVHVRLAGRFLEQDPTLKNVQANPAFPRGPSSAGGERNEFGLRGSVLWEADEVRSVLVRAHYEEDNGINVAPRNSSLAVGKHEISVGGDGLQRTDNEFFGASLEGKAQWRDWEIVSLTAAEGYNQQYGFDFDGSQAPSGNPNLNANLSYDRDFLQFSEELHARRSWSGGNVLVGLAAAAEDFSQTYTLWCGVLDPATLIGSCNYVGAPGRVGPTPASTSAASTLINDIDQTRETAAAFTYVDFNLSDRLTMTLGGRYTYEDIEGEGSGRHVFVDGTVALNNRGGLGAAIGSNQIIENRLTGNAALRYRLTDAGTLYAAVSNGYKSGGFNGEVQNEATHFQDEGLFGAETVTNLEAGYKARLGQSLNWSVAGFYQDYDAPQARIFVQFPLPDGSSIISNSLSNLDSAVSYGVEGDLRWAPLDGLDLVAGFTLVDSEISQDSDAAGTGNAALFDGNPLPFASDVSATLGARYEHRLSETSRLAWNANAKFQSAFYLDAEGRNDRRQGAYTLLDASVKWYLDDRDLELSVWGRNLLDEDYAVSGFGFIGYNTFRSDPRTFGVAATIRK